jgi:endo-1,4-beta-xylanase
MPHRRSILTLALTLLLPPTVAKAAAPDPYSGAAARIEKHRKADLTVVVRDAAGKPVPDARVSVEQTRHAFLFGCNIFEWGKLESPADEATYRERFAAVFNFATLPFYWPGYEPRKGQPEHANREAIARWCQEHGITTKGHPLAWNFADPRWLPADPEAARALQMARIDDCVARFRGLIDVFDVVNEATEYERSGLRRTAPKMTALIDHTGREGFVLEAFQHARAANPRATLVLNDYVVSEAYVGLLKRLIERSGGKPPFDVIGIQSHMHGGVWSDAKVWEVCDRFAAFGLPLNFTETTIVSGPRPPGRAWGDSTPGWNSTPEGEAKQAEQVERFYTLLFSHPAVTALTWWDFADRHAWQGAPAGFLRKDLSPKPSYDRLHTLIKERWWTRAGLVSDSHGEAHLRAFLGDYKVTATTGPGREAVAKQTVARGALNRLVVTLP